jgi:hypothetical protein
MTRAASFAVLAVAIVTPHVSAQTTDWPAADPEDVASVDAIIAAIYDVISGPKGQARDWDRFRSLFWPDAHLIPTGQPQGAPKARATFLGVQGYIDASGPVLEERGFFEREIGRVEERFGGIVHAFSAYDSRWTADGDVFQRGINSIQLMHDGERWWVINIFWQGVGPDAEIPARYLNR